MMYLSNYKKSLTKRYVSMELALNWFWAHGGRTIVETGTVRQKDDWGAGNSTLLFAEFADDFGIDFYSIDNSPEHIEISKEITKGLPVKYVLEDSVKALETFRGDRKFIDLLYLDSMDCPENGDATESQEHQLNELKAAWDKLSPRAAVLLDDAGFANGGKASKAKWFLKEKGWSNLWEAYQSLWVRT